MSELIITRGLPGSGKSTFARQVQRSRENVLIIERDMLRQELFGESGRLSHDQESEVTKVQEKRVRAGLDANATVIVSDTNLPDRNARRWIGIAVQKGADWSIEDMRDISLDEAIRRNFSREKAVPESVIRDMYSRYIAGKELDRQLAPPVVKTALEFEPVDRKASAGLYDAYIFDIDGTLAIKGDRDIYDGSKAHLDTVNWDVEEVMAHLRYADCQIIFMTGRREEFREVTDKWIYANLWRGSEETYELHMRADGDYRDDAIVKYELFNEHVRGKYDVLGVFDDRDRVVKMWRAIGLTCFQVAEGDF